MFQFHEGPIKTCLTTLKLVSFIRFQFHEGPIKTCEFCQSVPRGMLFQFHEGPIKTLRAAQAKQKFLGFNSMKVRLKPGKAKSEN